MTDQGLHTYASTHERVCVYVCISNLCTCLYEKKTINKEMHEVEKEQECYTGGFKVKKGRRK